MASGKNFYDRTEADLYNGSGVFKTKIADTPTTYGLSAAQALQYTALYDVFSPLYLACLDAETRTKVLVAQKKAAAKDLRTYSADLASIVRGFGVSDAQLIELGLHVRKQPAPQPAPDVAPGTHVVSVAGSTVLFGVHDSASSSKRGKAPNAVAAYVYYYVGATYPTDPTEWQFAGSATRHVYEVTFPESVDPGAQVWLCSAWVNRKGETGPVSQPITTRLQGGLVQAA